MRRKTKLLLILLIGICLALTLSVKFLMTNQLPDFPKSLPSVYFKDQQGKTIATSTYSAGKSLFIFFNSTCDICTQKAALFQEKNEHISGFSVIWVSNEHPGQVYQFSEDFGLVTSSNHTFLVDTEGFSFTDFMVTGTPTMLFYQNGELIKYFHNDFPVGYVIDQISEHH